MIKCFLMGLRHSNNVASACAPEGAALAHELIEDVASSGEMPFDFTLKALTVKRDGIHYSNDFSLVKTVWADYQPNSLAWPLFSERLKVLIEENLTGKEAVKWIPCNVCCDCDARKYYIPLFTRELDVLDKEKCFYTGNGCLIKPAFSPLKIRDYGIFPKPAKNNLWRITSAVYVSEKVRSEVKKAKMPEISFEQVLTV